MTKTELYNIKNMLIEEINKAYKKTQEEYEKVKEDCKTDEQFIDRMNILGKLEGLNMALRIINNADMDKGEKNN